MESTPNEKKEKMTEKSKNKVEENDTTNIKKMKQGMSYTRKEKTIILNVFKYFRGEYSDKCVTEIVRRTAKATGCSEKSVFLFRKEEKTGFKEPSKTKVRKNININSRYIKYDETVRQAIRTIIYDLKYKNIIPSLSTILKKVNNDVNLPNFSLMTLRRLLFDMGFYYEKDGRKSILTEKNQQKTSNDHHLPQDNVNKQIERTNLPHNPPNIPPPPSNYMVGYTSQEPQPHPHRVLPLHMPHHENHIHTQQMGMLLPTHNIPPQQIQSSIPIRSSFHIMQPGVYS